MQSGSNALIAFPPPYARRCRAYGFWLRHNLLRRLASTERQPARTPDIRPSSSLFLHHTRVVAARCLFIEARQALAARQLAQYVFRPQAVVSQCDQAMEP